MNPILLQKQLRQNASDLQDFCKDLKQWGEEMKQKEDSLKDTENKTTVTANKIRKSSKLDKKVFQKQAKLKDPIRKIGVTDYAAWDKFDADAECQELDESVNDDSDLTDEFNENVQDKALAEKEKGNKFVKNQNWDEAIKCYTQAIEYYSYDPIYYANRALCYLKKERFEDAENDCTLSLKLDNTYVKAYQRRAVARESLDKYEHAECDLLKVLELEPKNKESKTTLEQLRKKMGKINKPLEQREQRPVSRFTASRNKSNIINNTKDEISILPTSTKTENLSENRTIDTSRPVPVWGEEDNTIIVKPIKKPPHLRSTVPLKRIEIKEIDNNILQNKVTEMKDSEIIPIKKHVFENKQNTDKIIEEDSQKDMSAFKKKQLERNMRNAQKSAWPNQNQQSNCLSSEDFKIIENKMPENSGTHILSLSKDVKNTSNKNITINENNKLLESNDYTIPKTSIQFYFTWKNLSNTKEKYRFLKMIEPQDLPKIFLDSLESGVFSNILEVLVEYFIPNKDPVFSILYYLTQVKRFGTLILFMATTDKSNLWKLFDYSKETEQKNKEDVDLLLQKYEL